MSNNHQSGIHISKNLAAFLVQIPPEYLLLLGQLRQAISQNTHLLNEYEGMGHEFYSFKTDITRNGGVSSEVQGIAYRQFHVSQNGPKPPVIQRLVFIDCCLKNAAIALNATNGPEPTEMDLPRARQMLDTTAGEVSRVQSDLDRLQEAVGIFRQLRYGGFLREGRLRLEEAGGTRSWRLRSLESWLAALPQFHQWSTLPVLFPERN